MGALELTFLARPNSAAQQLENHDITTLDSKQWEETFQVNMVSPLSLICLPLARPHR